ncbi:polysaccharide deacetylase family protein [Kineococcus arenarius]|uniref:polysaccharide deacetylase family protein n=1 Tax=unclassified Kineococcus TaxID=2621656 RepID=UPI003D7C785F
MELSVSRTTRSRTTRRLVAAVALTLAALTAAPAVPAQAGRPAPEPITTARAGGQSVALTFDDGPNGADTERLLDVLRAHRVEAVFCLQGDRVLADPDLVRRIAAEGHTLCNHSIRHDDLGTSTPEQVRADLEATSALIRWAVPGADIPYFRAPYGSWGVSAQVADRMGMEPLGWTFDVADWEEPGAELIAQRVRERLVPRSVVLMHDGGGDRSGTVDAVAALVPELRAAGWRFTLPARRATRGAHR